MKLLYRLTIFSLFCGCSISEAATYSFSDLGSLGGYPSYAQAINSSGQVAGYGFAIGDFGWGAQAVTWNNGSINVVSNGGNGNRESIAYGVNDSGHLAGFIYTTDGARATLWSGATITDLGTLGGSSSQAYGINNAGQVVGYSALAGDVSSHATLWDGSKAIDLGALGGINVDSAAYAISNVGDVVGFSYTASGQAHATKWSGGLTLDLGTLGGTYSYAHSINDSGVAVGTSNLAGDLTEHATLWNGTNAIDLGTLGGSSSTAAAINDEGLVVGSSTIAGGGAHATLWIGQIATDLNTFLVVAAVSAGWVLTSAAAINSDGWIVGSAHNTITNESHAYLLSTAEVASPVPNAQAFATTIAGLILVAFLVRRRQMQQSTPTSVRQLTFT